jgi:hypothetical protein
VATPDTPALGADEQDQQPTSGTAKKKKEGPLPPQTVVGEELGLAPWTFFVACVAAFFAPAQQDAFTSGRKKRDKADFRVLFWELTAKNVFPEGPT